MGRPKIEPHQTLYVLEKRHQRTEEQIEKGLCDSLDFSQPQPPNSPNTIYVASAGYWTEKQLFDHYFKFNKDRESVTQEEVKKWFQDQGFYYRPKTW
jgi:hypothetical protein